MTTSQTITIRAKAFRSESARQYRMRVDADGTVRVYDSTAGHFTTCHSLTARTIARARKIAWEQRARATAGREALIAAKTAAELRSM